MASLSYPFQFTYPYIGGNRFPVLQLRVQAPQEAVQPVDVDAFLDSGTERSLFEGWIATAVGLSLLEGQIRRYRSAGGQEIEARMHRIQLLHDDLGSFDLEVGFSLSEISRNLLGRDFFNLIQIGFREHQLTFYVDPTP